ncbi:sporulation integral membrane protein YtvI [Peribacillus loiseleuriae]|uniref:sporulation integral membrane protein YtvI n=1 Tax=Peribacillus loiseleuriae TaxID=1679170 RepID=UPI0038088F08
MNPVYLQRFIRFCIVIGAAMIGGLVLFYLSKYTYPFIIAMIFAFFMNPLVNFFELKTRLPRGIAVFLSLLLILSGFAGLITLLIAEIVSGANYLAKVVPGHLETVIRFIEEFIAGQLLPLYNQSATLFNNLDGQQQDTILSNIRNLGDNLATSVGSFIQKFLLNIPAFIAWFPNAATVLVFSFLATFFISKDWKKLSNFSNKVLPPRILLGTGKVIKDLKGALLGFIKAQFTLISLTTVTVLIGLLILRVEYSITIALVSGLIDIIPYLGTGTVFIPWIAYEVIIGNYHLAIGLIVVYVIVVVQRQLVEPKVLSSSIGIDPIATLLALFVGYKLIGFLGLIAGPVVLVIINTLHRANVFKAIWNFVVGREGPRIR